MQSNSQLNTFHQITMIFIYRHHAFPPNKEHHNPIYERQSPDLSRYFVDNLPFLILSNNKNDMCVTTETQQ